MNFPALRKYISMGGLRLLILSLVLFLAGCDDAREKLLESAWGAENLQFVRRANSSPVEELQSYELWIARVEQQDDDEIVLADAVCLESCSPRWSRRVKKLRRIEWPRGAYPDFQPSEDIAFVALRDLKGRLILQTDRIAKIEEHGDVMQVTPQKIKRCWQSFMTPGMTLEISAGTERPVFAPGDPVNLEVTFANYGQHTIMPSGNHPAEFMLELADGKTGSPLPPKHPKSVRLPVPDQLEADQTKSIKIDLADLFPLASEGDYTVTVTGQNEKFRLTGIEFEMRQAALRP